MTELKLPFIESVTNNSRKIKTMSKWR